MAQPSAPVVRDEDVYQLTDKATLELHGAQTALSASALGMLTGLFPIGWIILMAVFLFNLTVESGQFEVIKRSISSLSPDRRIQLNNEARRVTEIVQHQFDRRVTEIQPELVRVGVGPGFRQRRNGSFSRRHWYRAGH